MTRTLSTCAFVAPFGTWFKKVPSHRHSNSRTWKTKLALQKQKTPKNKTETLTNPDTSSGLRVTAAVRAEARRVQEGMERVAKEKERKKEE